MAAVPGAENLHRDRDEEEERIRFFNTFLHNNRDHYEKHIKLMLNNNCHRITVMLQELEDAQPGLQRLVLENPVKYIPAWESALFSFVRDIDEKFARTVTHPLKIDIQGAFGRNHVSPRGLTSSAVGKLMCVEGMVTKAGITAPKILQSIHLERQEFGADKPPAVVSRDHRDATALVTNAAPGGMPKEDSEGRRLDFDLGLSIYKDTQKFTLQETPENAPAGQIPQFCEVICEGDLTDTAKPGERVRVIGVYRSFPGQLGETTDGKFPARLIATNITSIKKIVEPMHTPTDVRNIHRIAKRKDAFELLARSFAPSICGHEIVKKGLLLQQLGGVEKDLPNKTHLRGDINLLLVGDPSCGKSQMLRFVLNVAPLAISTTGRGATGVGLTAAVTRDPGSRDFNLEAGAMVLADRGFICIDEFDKMSINDRVAIHEAMEQQCITIAKAGIHTTLNARCSVVAAANPRWGNFDDTKSLTENLNLPDSLLSRFDLVYVVRDTSDDAVDRKISSQVLRQARLRIGGTKRGVEALHSSILERTEDASKKAGETPVFETKYSAGGEEAPKTVTVDFLTKYIKAARKMKPVLTEEARFALAERYTDMRMRFQSNFLDRSAPGAQQTPKLAVTTRTLEGLIRLATAHAKLKMQPEVTLEDVEEAYKLMLLAREEKVLGLHEGGDEAGGDGTQGAGDGDDGAPPMKRARRKGPAVSQERVQAVKTLVVRTIARWMSSASGARDPITTPELLKRVNEAQEAGEEAVTDVELDRVLAALEVDEKIVRDGDTIFSMY